MTAKIWTADQKLDIVLSGLRPVLLPWHVAARGTPCPRPDRA